MRSKLAGKVEGFEYGKLGVGYRGRGAGGRSFLTARLLRGLCDKRRYGGRLTRVAVLWMKKRVVGGWQRNR